VQPPKPVGFVVRTTPATSLPLAPSMTPSATASRCSADHDEGTIFPTWEAAFKAVEGTVAYEIAHGYSWSEMYGDMLIEPLYRRNATSRDPPRRRDHRVHPRCRRSGRSLHPQHLGPP
jgi:hypothetical protein